MGIKLGTPDIVITFPPMESIPDGPEDKPTPGPQLDERIGPLHLPELISGAATWAHFYNEDETLITDVPLRTIRLALRYGFRAFDTAPYYDNSEIILGTALNLISSEFPRSSYKLISKVGRYGPEASDFDYTPETLRASVRRSLRRLHTPYLDVVYLHDIEFVAPCIAPRVEGVHTSALDTEAKAYGLDPVEADKGGMDERVLGAIDTLRSLQSEGLIRHIGICGLQLPTLLRTALLVLARTGRPLDVVQTYAHLTLQNATLLPFVKALSKRAKVTQVFAASPLAMGLLAPPPSPPAWHPAPRAVLEAASEAVRAVGKKDVAKVAVAWSVCAARGQEQEGRMPVVIGMSNVREVHEAVEAWRWARDEGRQEELTSKAALAQDVFERTGTAGWTWKSGNWS